MFDVKEHRKEYYQKNKEKWSGYRKKYRENNKERMLELERIRYASDLEGNRNKLREKNRKRRSTFKKWMDEKKIRLGCVDCGYNASPSALDFDHVSGEKLFCVSRGVNLRNIVFESLKCVVRCANCHRIRHFTNPR